MPESVEVAANGQEQEVKADTSSNGDKHVADKPIPADFVDLIADGKNDGVYKWIKKAAITDEQPVENDTVYVHYTGRLWGGARDGEQFDSSRTRGEPFKFELGKRMVIRGWDVGVATMKRGEIADIICRPAFAYGPAGTGGIPPNATLCFEVELLDFHGEDISEDKDKSLTKRTLTRGTGFDSPGDFGKVKVNLIGRVSDAPSGTEPFDRREAFEFIVGEGSASEPVPIPAGLESAVSKMKKGEHAKLTIKPQHAFGKDGLLRDGAVQVPPNATVEYDVELLDLVKAKETWELNPEEKIEEARRFKERANGAFTKAHYGVAEKCYKHVVKLLEDGDSAESENQQEKIAQQRTLRLTAHANLAQTYLNLHRDQDALQHAEKALEIESQHPKALFRKGVALQRLLEFEAAKTAFQYLLVVEPSNRAAQREITVCENRLKQQLNAEKKLYRTMFEKVAAREEDELDKIERERAEKAKAEREAEEAKKKNHGEGKCGSCPGSDDEAV